MSGRHCAAEDEEGLAEEDMREGHVKSVSRGNNFSRGPGVRRHCGVFRKKN